MGQNIMNLKIEQGDITLYDVDAIVNAANSSLLGGGGVDGAIHRAAGPKLVEECRTLNGCPTGDAKITKGYNLKAHFVIHTVGPVYYEDEAEQCEKMLKNCYQNSLKLAKENNCKSIAFPLISAGIYGYPKDEALKIAVETIKEFDAEMEATIVLFDREIWKIAEENYEVLLHVATLKDVCRNNGINYTFNRQIRGIF